MTKLSVNVNKIATLRNARGGNIPSVCDAALAIESYGAQGITVHPRPDQRHIRYQDVRDLKKALRECELNVEGYPEKPIIDLISEVRPTQVTLVPDPPHVLTSNAGWLIEQEQQKLKQAVAELRKRVPDIRVSVFVDPNTCRPKDLELIQAMGIHRIELYTERYAKSHGDPSEKKVLEEYARCAEDAANMGVGVNAGHDLNQKNLPNLLERIPSLLEVSIGHELIAESLYSGLKKTVQNYLAILG